VVHLIEFVSRCEHDTLRFGCQLAGHLSSGDIVALKGVLGSGKSVLARGIMRGLGVSGAIPSPSFIMVANYKGRLPINHIDLYRMEAPEDIETIGLEDAIFSEAISIIEWADKIEYLLPARTIRVSISPCKDIDMRLITIESLDANVKSRLTSLAIDILREKVDANSRC